MICHKTKPKYNTLNIYFYTPMLLYTNNHMHNTNISGNIVNNNIRTSMNEWTNTLLYKNIPLTLYSRKGWFWLCVRGKLETGTDCYILIQSSSDHSSTFPHSGWAAQLWVTKGPKSSLCCWLSRCHLVPNWLQLELTQAICGTWLYNCLPSTCFRCSSAYLHRCISWLTARSRVNIWHMYIYSVFVSLSMQ